MKQFYRLSKFKMQLLCCIFLMIPFFGSSQCPTEDLTFTTQAEIDKFIIDYPNCTTLDFIWVDGKNDEIDNLEGFKNITTLGFLTVKNLQIEDFSDLSSLDLIRNSLNITNLPRITSLTGLENISGLSYLDLRQCSNITSLNGIENAMSTKTSLKMLSLISLENLSDISALSNISSIEDPNIPWSIFYLSNLNSLQTIESFLFQIKSIKGPAGFSGLPYLKTFDLNHLSNTSHLGSLFIGNNPNLEEVLFSENLSIGSPEPSTNSYLRMINNPKLEYCNSASICKLINESPENKVIIENNAQGCNSVEEVQAECTTECPTGYLRFTTQAEVDQFIIEYPNCNSVLGIDLDGSDITSTAPFINITNLNTLYLRNTNITNVDGFTNLESVAHEYGIYIAQNQMLENLDGLGNVSYLAGDLVIIQNQMLENIEEFNNVTDIGGSLSIGYNDNLASIGGFEKLTNISEDLVIEHSYNLNSIVGFEKLTSINGGLFINTNDLIENFDFLEKLTNIGNFLIIQHNDNLVDISGIRNIESVLTVLSILSNSKLSNCSIETVCNSLELTETVGIRNNAEGCSSVEEVQAECNTECPTGYLRFTTQAEVDQFLIEYPNCNSVLGIDLDGSDITSTAPFINITNLNTLYLRNTSITNVDGFINLESVAHEYGIYIAQNQMLENLDGIGNVSYLAGDLKFYFNNKLEKIEGFNNVTDIGGTLYFGYNDNLASIGGFEKLTNISGNLDIQNSHKLKSIGGFEKLTSINGGLLIAANDLIENFDFLENLTNIGNYLIFRFNDNLVDIYGVRNIESVLTTLSIQSNPLLSKCAIAAVCNNIANPSSHVTIENNAEGCNSVEEVEAICNDECPDDPNKTEPGECGCGVEDLDTDQDGVLDCNDDEINSPCPDDVDENGVSNDDDGDGTPNCNTVCPTEDLTLSTQAEVDQFIIDYPNCTEITGNVKVEGTDIVNLAGLKELTKLVGELEIVSTSLTDLSDLTKLTEVTHFIAEDNQGLTNLSGLENLTTSSTFSVINNHSLISYSGFNVELLNRLTLINNNGIENLLGLEKLQDLGELIITGNSNLKDLEGLTTILDRVDITNNPLLSKCAIAAVCNNIANPSSHVIIENNAEGCNSVEEVEAICNDECPDDPNKTEPGECGCGVEDLDTDQDGVLDCNDDEINSPCPDDVDENGVSNDDDGDGTPNCNTVCPTEDLTLSTQAEVDQFIIDYPNCTEITGNVKVEGTDIVNLAGLKELTKLVGELEIVSTSLTDLSDLTKLTEVTHFIAEDNQGLTNLSGLENLTTSSTFSVINNHSLISFSGFNVELLNRLTLINNNGVENLLGLEKLQELGELIITGNSILKDLEGLTTILDRVDITNNPLLSKCAIAAVCNNIANPSSHVTIENNAEGCNSVEEVQAICNDECPDDPNKTEPGECGCGVEDLDTDQDGVLDCNDDEINSPCPDDVDENGVSNDDDGDGVANCITTITVGVPEMCKEMITVTIDETNNNQWHSVVDENGSIAVQFNPNGNNLGDVFTNVYLSSSDGVAMNDNGATYLRRAIQIEPEFQPETDVSVRLYILRDEFNDLMEIDQTLNSISDLIWEKKSGASCDTQFGNDGETIITMNGPFRSNGYYSEFNVSSFSTFYAGSAALLPVNLVYFNGESTENGNELTWETASESNTSHFDVQQTADGLNWNVIGKVEAVGYSTQLQSYSFIDESPERKSFYRLNILDFDGSSEFSDTIEIDNVFLNENQFIIFPNPASNEFKVSNNSGENIQSISIYSMNGSLINRVKDSATGIIDINELSKGVYIVIIQTENKVIKRKLVKE